MKLLFCNGLMIVFIFLMLGSIATYKGITHTSDLLLSLAVVALCISWVLK